jgi:hypothetical protein
MDPFRSRVCTPWLCVQMPPLLETTKCPEPLCPIEALPLSARSLLHRVGGRYPSFLAPTDSCARPSSSHLLDSRLVWWVFAGCHQSLLDAGPSRRCLCMSFLGCLAPYPGVSPGALSRFFPEDSGLPPGLTGSALPQFTRTATSARKPISGLQTFLDVQASKFARHPGRSDRYHLRRMAAVAFTSEHRIVRYLSIRRIC